VLIAAGVLQFGLQLTRYPVMLGLNAPAAEWLTHHAPSWFFPQAVFWFVFGTFAGFHLPSLEQWLSRWKRVLPWATVTAGALAFLEWELLLGYSGSSWLPPVPTAVDTFYSAGFILTFMAFAPMNVPVRRQLDALGEKSFGVYLAHAPVLEIVSRASYHIAPFILGYQFLFQPLLIAAGVGVPLLLMMMVNRSPARQYYNYLFG
jgi:peptidoglycan/LPS O-acetylase OafA/YrhL